MELSPTRRSCFADPGAWSAAGDQCCSLCGRIAMDLHDEMGRVGLAARSLASEVVIEQDYRDYLIGRLLLVRGKTGTPNTLFEVLDRGTLTLRDLEGIIAAAEGRRPH